MEATVFLKLKSESYGVIGVCVEAGGALENESLIQTKRRAPLLSEMLANERLLLAAHVTFFLGNEPGIIELHQVVIHQAHA